MNYKSSLTCFTLLAATAFAAPAVWAQGVPEDRKDSGFFVTGSYGGYKSHGGSFEDENDLIGVSAGYHFNPFFALEADYLDFGKFGDDDFNGQITNDGPEFDTVRVGLGYTF